MMTPNTNERVDGLMQLSDRIYPIIDQQVDGEATARRVLRVGIATTAQALREQASPAQAGDLFHTQLLTTLDLGGLSTKDAVYQHWPRYQRASGSLHQTQDIRTTTAFDSLSNAYADTLRATKNAAHQNETDATHAIHLSALALPYAAEFYPELSQGKIALYCLVHDILEAYTGDIATLSISDVDLQSKHDNEALALIKFQKDYNNRWREFVAVVHDYENIVDKESAFVKSFDKLDPGFTHFANNGVQLLNLFNIKSAKSFISEAETTVRRMAQYATPFQLVIEDRHTLHLRIANEVPWPE